jgi:PTH1 family peptidyl-tRNA hydrolase
MALFARRPQTSNVSSLYTVGLNNTIAIIGLGNIGEKYEQTRHNIGFKCLDNFAIVNEFPGWVLKKDIKAAVSIKTLGDSRVILMKPTTLMNLSGDAVMELVQFYKIPATNILVVHDELDIEFGKIRSKIGGSSAGHNGIQSIIDVIGADFSRLRIGIGPKTPEQIDSADFVLQKFTAKELKHMEALCLETSSMINEYIFGDRSLLGETRTFII